MAIAKIAGGAAGAAFLLGLLTGWALWGGSGGSDGERLSLEGMAGSDTLFILDGKEYTQQDLSPALRSRLFDLRRSGYEQSLEIIQNVASHIALAKAKGAGSSSKDLPPIAELAPEAVVTDKEVRDHYEKNRRSFPAKIPYERIKAGIEEHFRTLRERSAVQKTLRTLTEAGRLQIVIPPPLDAPADLEVDDFPEKGSGGLELTVFVDYRSSWSGEASRALTTGAEPPYRVIMVPVPTHGVEPANSIVERASLCLWQQSPEAFWAFHQSAFGPGFRTVLMGADSDGAAMEWARAQATTFQPKMDEFQECLADKATEALLEQARAMADDLGIHRFPAFFLNGQRIGVADTRIALPAIRQLVNQLSQTSSETPPKEPQP